MTRVREMRAFSGSFDAVSVAAAAGIDVFLGDSQFVGPDAVEVDGQRLRVPQGAHRHRQRPGRPGPPRSGVGRVSDERDRVRVDRTPAAGGMHRAGIVNCELAQALRRLGSEVDLVGSGGRLLPSAAPAASDLLAGRLGGRGGAAAARPAHDGGGRRAAARHAGGGTELLLRCPLVGDRPPVRVDGLGLELAVREGRPCRSAWRPMITSPRRPGGVRGRGRRPAAEVHALAAIATADGGANALEAAGEAGVRARHPALHVHGP